MISGSWKVVFPVKKEPVDVEVDVELNLQIEKHRAGTTIYAIEPFIRDEEPLFLIVDDRCSDREFTLKYGSDDESEDIPKNLPDSASKLKQPVTVPQ